MNKDQLLKACDAFIAQDARFQRIEAAPSFLKVGDQEYSEIAEDGTWEGRPARLVSLRHDDTYILHPERNYDAYLNAHLDNFPKAVRVPSLLHEVTIGDLDVGYVVDMHFYVVERPEGKPIISNDLLMQSFAANSAIQDQLQEFARVYRDTVGAIKNACVDGAIPTVCYEAGISAAGYIRQRFLEIKRSVQEDPVKGMPRLVSNRQLTRLLAGLFLDADWDKVSMELCFSNFTNESIVKTKEGVYYVTTGRLDLRPEHFGFATFLQEASLYGFRKSVEQIEEDLKISLEIFAENLGGIDDYAGEALQLNMAERIYDAIENSLRYRIGIYNHLPVETARNMQKVLYGLLLEHIDFLEL